MVSYPVLTDTQQSTLPALIKPATPIPEKFEDSTHRLWSCDTVDGAMILKVCNQAQVDDSLFWVGMNSLFGIDFPKSLGEIASTHHLIKEYGLLDVPDYIAARPDFFVLTRFLDGEDVHSEQVTDEMVVQMAKHLGKLHQHRHLNWGAIHQPQFEANTWGAQLKYTLSKLLERHSTDLSESDLVARAAEVTVTDFVPIMPDLRWDQFRHRQGDLYAVVDLDAFVIGPKELELTILEYQVSPTQALLFKQVYETYLSFPDLKPIREVYRLLFFLMNALGEQNLKDWMHYPAHFDV